MGDVASNQTLAARYLLLYATAFLAVALFTYYLPDYATLEAMIAEHSAGVLNAIGIPAEFTVAGNGAYVNNVQIVRECTGVQVIAVFAGILLPFPRIDWMVKFKAVAILAFSVYLANVMRVALELWLLYAGILPWSMAHGPFGSVLSMITIFIFFLVSDRFVPQIGASLGRLADWAIDGVKRVLDTHNKVQK